MLGRVEVNSRSFERRVQIDEVNEQICTIDQLHTVLTVMTFEETKKQRVLNGGSSAECQQRLPLCVHSSWNNTNPKQQ